MALVENELFSTTERLLQLQQAKEGGEIILDHHAAPLDERHKMGTVGAVALDLAGNLAAATSTGGMTNKLPGRVGDSSVPGAGCYANNASVAVSLHRHRRSLHAHARRLRHFSVDGVRQSQPV